MIYINPNSISNSGNNKYFTNQSSKISLKLLNVLSNADLITLFILEQFDQKKLEQFDNKIVQSSNNDDFRTILQNQKRNLKFNGTGTS